MILDDLQSASFTPSSTGIPVGFLVPRESEGGGRKVAVHEYPGSDSRFVQDLGRRQPVFSIVALIHGLDVLQQRQRLTQALLSGEGVLIHPYVGRRVVSPVDWTARTSDAALGEVIYDVEFLQTDDAFGLLGSADGIQDVFAAAEGARDALDAAATSAYSPLAIQDSIQKVGDRVGEALDIVQSTISNVVNPVQDTLNEVTKQISLAKADVLSISRTPLRLFQAARGVFDAVLSVAETPADIADEWSRLANFGSVPRTLSNGQISSVVGTVRDAIPRTTLKRILEDDNLRAFEQYFRISALINSFEAEASKTFETDAELQSSLDRLFDDFTRIIRDQADVTATSDLGDEVLTGENVTEPSDVVSEATAFSRGISFDPSVVSSMERLKVATFAVLQNADTAPFKVDQFDLGLTDVQLSTYTLYGDLDRLEIASNLNSDVNHALIKQPVKGLVV